MLLKLPDYQSSYDNQFLSSLSLSEKIAFYKKEIENIADTSFNKQQKKLCLDILDKATEENIDKIYQFITQRVKTGFVFDIAPEVQNDCIALIEKDKKLSFESNALGEKLTHKLIIGENYDALKNLLAVYENKIDFIYIDPPYNTESTRTDGNSLTDIEGQNTGKFIYRDKYSRTGWLNMMNERLQLARKLLSDKGVIFISIDDNEQAYLKVLCDDVFGEENFVKELVWESGKPFGYKATTHTWPRCHEYILHYAKNINKMIYNPTYTLEISSNGKQILTSSIIKAKENGIYSMDWIQGAKESVGFGSGQKPVNLIKKLLQNGTSKNSIILDFFAGSGTTGQAVMELNEEDGGKRQFILCTNNENGIAENITYERLRRVINGVGTKGEQIKWQYSKDKKSLTNNNLDVFRIGYHQLEIEDYEKGEQLIKQAKEVFKQLDNNFELKGEFDIYNKLASLKPYSEEDRAECAKGFSYQNKQAGEVEDVENEEEQD